MSSKEEMVAIVSKYIKIYKGDSSRIHNHRWADLKTEELKRLSPLSSEQGISPFSMREVRCVKSSGCQRMVYGYYPREEIPAEDCSNFVIPPLCGEHLLEAVETLDQLLVQALLSLDQKIEEKKIVMPSATFLRNRMDSADSGCWRSQPRVRPKNRME